MRFMIMQKNVVKLDDYKLKIVKHVPWQIQQINRIIVDI